jgi:hypothetical protein
MLALQQCRCSSKFGVPAREIQTLQDRDIGNIKAHRKHATEQSDCATSYSPGQQVEMNS